MEGKILHTLGLVLALSCVIIVAKNESEKTENESKNMNSTVNLTNLDPNYFTEASRITPHVVTSEEPKKNKVKGRKGVSFEDMKSTSNESDPEPTKSSSTTTSVTVQTKLSSPSGSNETSKVTTSTPVIIKNSSKEVTHLVTSAPSSSTTTTTTSSTTSTQAPIHKPTITYSADDYDAIKESEKNINYKVGKEKSPDDAPAPKASEDVDRAVLEEKRAHKSYMVYLGLAVVLPLAVVAINLAYKRVKTYLELREYQRVDFLVDGMYVS